ncbi:MAG: Crp/Fnr family transcriptional regulator [Bacteroidales bacterium]
MNTEKKIAEWFGKTVSPLDENALNEFASILVYIEIKKNNLLVEKADIGSQLYYVHSGLLRQFYCKDGKDLTEHFACEGNIIMSMKSDSLYKSTPLMIEALESAVLYAIPHEPLARLACKYSQVSVMYRRIMEWLLIGVQSKIDSIRSETATERYRRLMKERPEIIQRAPLIHVASYLLMSPETLSRVRGRTF